MRAWVKGELAPNAEDWERERDFPVRDVMRAASALGLFGAKYEECYGGTGPDLIADAVITEELSRCGSGGVAAALGAHKDQRDAARRLQAVGLRQDLSAYSSRTTRRSSTSWRNSTEMRHISYCV